MKLDLILFIMDIYISSNLNSLKAYNTLSFSLPLLLKLLLSEVQIIIS